jgi:hypothetical protein
MQRQNRRNTAKERRGAVNQALASYGQGRTATSRLSIVSSIAKGQAMAIVLMSFEYSFQCLR